VVGVVGVVDCSARLRACWVVVVVGVGVGVVILLGFLACLPSLASRPTRAWTLPGF
jgi:hypothetical protein